MTYHRMQAAMLMASHIVLAASATVQAQEWKTAPQALAAAPQLPVKAFSQLGAMASPKVSPDGTKLIYITQRDGRKHVAIRAVDPNARALLIPPPGNNYEIRWANWANNERILIGVGTNWNRGNTSQERTRETRLISIKSDGTGAFNPVKANTETQLGSRIGKVVSESFAVNQDDVIHFTPDDPETILLSIWEDYRYPNSAAVRQVNVNTGKNRIIFTGQTNIGSYSADWQGNVRIGWGATWAINNIKPFIIYKDPDSGKWTKFNEPAILNVHNDFLGFAPDPRFAYVLTAVDGIKSLVKWDMRTQAAAETLFRDPTTDVESMFRDETGQAIGVELAGGSDVFFDKKWAGRISGLRKAVGNSDISVSQITDDGKFILLTATSPSEPGAYYLYDVTQRGLTPIGFSFAGLGPENAPYRTKIDYKARDGLTIPSILTLPRGKAAKNLPTIILPHGGPWAHDDVNYDWEAAFLANRGYAVLQPNFRGSTGFGAAHLDAGNGEWGLKMQDDITDGAQWMIAQGIADKSRMCIVGGSYGGYAALMGAVRTPDLFKCAASVNGVSDIVRMMTDDLGAMKEASFTYRIGDRDKELDKLKANSPYNNVDKIKIPVLLAHARDDLRVDIKQSQRMNQRLQSAGKPVTYVEIERGEHWLENEQARLNWLGALETFLRQNIGN